jgi:capsular exopolysaccharide synthesis family protein
MPANMAEGVGIVEIWQRLLRQKWTVLLVALPVFLLTAYLTWTTPPTYRAETLIQIEKEGARVVEFNTISQTAPDLGEQDPFFRTQYEQLKSRKLAEQVISEQELAQRQFDRPQPANFLKTGLDTLKDWITGWFASKPSAGNVTKADEYVNQFQTNLYVEPIEHTHLVKVFYESQDPILSAQVVNALVDAFIKSNLGAQTETDTYAKEFLEKELEKARDRLTMQEAKLVEYAKQNNILEASTSPTSQEKKLDDLYLALGTAERNRIQAESMLIQSRGSGNVRDVLGNPLIEGIKQNLVTLEADYQEKLKLFKPAYPDMQRLQQQIQSVRSQLNREIGSLKQSLQADYNAASKVEADIRAELDNYKGELVNLRDKSIEYNALKREVETSRNLYDGLLQRMKETSVVANMTSSNIKVVDAAAPATDVFRPKKKINLMLGALAGLLLGIGAALLRETLGQNVTSVSELQALSGLPVLGTIPRVRTFSRQALTRVSIRGEISPLAEAYRVAAANLRFISPCDGARVTLFTSANPAEGKSTSAINIAVSQAQQGLKVLLIDADMRKPSIHTKLGLRNDKGLSNFLSREVEIAAVTQAARDVKGLYVVTAGSAVANPVSLVSGPVMVKLLELATQHFDSIVIDAPPVLGFADTLYLASFSHASIMVVDEDNTHRKRLLSAMEQLQRVRHNVVGFLMVKSGESPNYRYYRRPRPEAFRFVKAAKIPRTGLNLATG